MKHGMLVVLMLMLAVSAHSFPGSVPAGYAYDPPNNNTCWNCHDTYAFNSGDGTISYSSVTEYEPGQSYTIQITLTDNVYMAGFQATVKDMSNQFAGQVYVVDATNTQMSGSDYINHTEDGTLTDPNGGTWTIGWTAPAAGTGDVILCVASAACNDGNGNNNDYVYGEQFTITEASNAPYGLTTTGINTVVPAAGGNISYSVDFFTNLPQAYMGVTYWTTLTLPDGSESGTQFSIVINVPPFADMHVPMLVQAIPSFAPAGDYMHNSKLGMFPVPVLMDSFAFTKTAVVTDDAPVSEWSASGKWPAIAADGEDVVEVPSDFALNAAYPNPFNAMTTISVTLPETAELSLNVYNVMGEVVSELSQGSISAGTHEFSFDASNLSSGIYFVQANVPGKMSEIQKITLVK
jgi:Secretion system C-terminal sorting domain